MRYLEIFWARLKYDFEVWFCPEPTIKKVGIGPRNAELFVEDGAIYVRILVVEEGASHYYTWAIPGPADEAQKLIDKIADSTMVPSKMGMGPKNAEFFVEDGAVFVKIYNKKTGWYHTWHLKHASSAAALDALEGVETAEEDEYTFCSRAPGHPGPCNGFRRAECGA